MSTTGIAKLRPDQVRAIVEAINALDGYEDVIGVGESSRAIRRAYKMPFELRYALGHNKALAVAFVDAYATTHNEIIRRHANGADHIDAADRAAVDRCRSEILALDGRAQDFEYWPICLDALEDESVDNPIPPSVFAALLPLHAADGAGARGGCRGRE